MMFRMHFVRRRLLSAPVLLRLAAFSFFLLFHSSTAYSGMGSFFGGGTAPVSSPTISAYLTSIVTGSNEPARIAIGGSGLIYASMPECGQVKIFALDGSQAGAFNGFQEPLSVAVDIARSRVYVGDAADGSVTVISQSGQQLFSLGNGRGEFGMPGDIAVTADGTVYVTDSIRDEVKIYSVDGNLLSSFGGTGTVDGNMRFPTGIAVDDEAHEIYVADQLNARIQVFDAAGAHVRSFSQFGVGGGRLTRPQGIWIANGKVYVADAFQGAVSVFDRAGLYLETLGQFGTDPGCLKIPKDVAASGGRLFVANTGNRRIEVFGIGDPSALSIDPPTIAYIKEFVVSPSSRTIQITPLNAGAAVPWTSSVTAPFSVILSQNSGTAPSSVAVSIDAGALTHGMHSGVLVIHSGANTYPVNIVLTVVPQLFVSPETLSLLQQVNGVPANRSLTITGSAPLSWTVESSAPWLVLSPSSGATPGSIMVAAGPGAAGLPEGVYNTTVTVQAPGAAGSPAIIPVSLKVAIAGTLQIKTNLDAASYTLTGPTTYSGTGRNWSTDEAVPGTYHVQYGHVKGYRRPASRTVQVVTGQRTTIDGSYRPLPIANVIAAAKGADPMGDAVVRLFDLNGEVIQQFKTLPTKYGAKIAMGDVDGDGSAEVIVAPGPGPGNEAQVGVYRVDGIHLVSRSAIRHTRYGACVAVGDIVGSGRSFIALSMMDDEREQGRISIYALDDNSELDELVRLRLREEDEDDGDGHDEERDDGVERSDEMQYPASIAFGDVNGDGRLELIVTRDRKIEVYAFDDDLTATRIAAGKVPSSHPRGDVKALPSVSTGDINNDGIDEIIISQVVGQDGIIQVLKGDLSLYDLTIKAFENAKSSPTLSAMDWGGDGLAEILTGGGASPGSEAVIRVYSPLGGFLKEFKVFPNAQYGADVSFGAIDR